MNKPTPRARLIVFLLLAIGIAAVVLAREYQSGADFPGIALLKGGTVTPTPGSSSTPVIGAPYPGAPLCASHDNSTWHGLWNAAAGCHYDHEHGDNPFTPEVAAVFPGFDLRALLGDVEVGHAYPTSPLENTVKHGGFKWTVALNLPCVGGFEGAQWCVAAAVIQYHLFGDLSLELSGRVHSVDVLVKVCDPANVTDCGYLFTVAHVDYGQRVAPYQGPVLPYPDNFQPEWAGGFGPYWSTGCIGTGLPNCAASIAYILSHNQNVNSVITNKPTGFGPRPTEPELVRLLTRTRDNYQVLDSADLEYPFTFRYVCGDTAYLPAGCRYNNSTSRAHEVGGNVPASWDGDTWDTDTRTGRVTGTGLLGGFPFKAVGMFVGRYGGELTPFKVSNPTPASNPERDIYFCSGVVCAETDAGAAPRGWIGLSN